MKTVLQLIGATILIVVASVLHAMFKAPAPIKEITKADISNPGTLSFGPEYKLLLASKDADEMSKIGFIPLCDPTVTTACLVLDNAPYQGTNLEAAAIAMRAWPGKDESSCLNGEDQQTAPRNLKIGGVTFATFELSGAATGHTVSGRIYRTFHKDLCYEIGASVATARYDKSEGVYSREFTEADKKTVEEKLESTIRTFRFND